MMQLYINVGIPGSGKSTIAVPFANQMKLPIVSRDEIRFNFLKNDDNYFKYEKLVFNTFVSMIVKNLKEIGGCLADATHINFASRNKLISAIAQEINVSEFTIHYICFDIPLETCIARNEQRTGWAYVPPATIETMYKSLEFPTIDEFSNVESILRIKE